MSDVTILCDMRESKSGVIEHLRQHGARVQLGELETGDFVISGSIAIERKTATDFVASILNGRLHNQAGKMRLNFERPVFLLLGDIYSTRSAIAREAIDGAVSFLTAVEGITVLSVLNEYAAAGLIFRMAKHAQNGLGYDVAFRRGKVEPGQGEALFAIEGMPGVGPTTAIKILNHFRSINAFMNASVEELMKVPGLGPKKAERIHKSIHWHLPAGEVIESARSLFSEPV
jgi:ERCC4-type nuclease